MRPLDIWKGQTGVETIATLAHLEGYVAGFVREVQSLQQEPMTSAESMAVDQRRIQLQDARGPARAR
jgi:hypothetical protein